MGKELHVGAGLLVLAATCGRVAMKSGDDVLRHGDVLVAGARHLDDAGNVRHLDEALRHGDALRYVDEAEAGVHRPIDDLLKDVASEGAQLTAEQLLTWDDALGEAEDDDLTGVWRREGSVQTVPGLAFEQTCARDQQGATYGIRCSEVGVRDGREIYRARWSGQQAIGTDGICTLVGSVSEARIAVQDEEAEQIAAHLQPRLGNGSPCVERYDLGRRPTQPGE